MTEDEAKKKWCPYSDSQPNFGRLAGSRVCLASECMAWRWRRDPAFKDVGGGFLKQNGYCGLAGRPE